MPARPSLAVRVAMELRQIEAEEACLHPPYRLNAAETWARASAVLHAGYLSDARRLLKVIREHEREAVSNTRG